MRNREGADGSVVADANRKNREGHEFHSCRITLPGSNRLQPLGPFV
jgi:hypothetical protein